MADYDITRFAEAQFLDYDLALREIRAGHKRSHWIWYIFPQLQGLGSSLMCQRYGINGLDEACDYLADQNLSSNLVEISTALLEQPCRDAVAILGPIDAKKVRSCMTLFALASGSESVFLDVLREFYGGSPDERTLELLGVSWPW